MTWARAAGIVTALLALVVVIAGADLVTTTATYEYDLASDVAPVGQSVVPLEATSTTPPANARTSAARGERSTPGDSRSLTSSISRRRAAKALPEGATSQILMRTPKQLQSKFKHAGDFGLTGNYNKGQRSAGSARRSTSASTTPQYGRFRAPTTSSRSRTTLIPPRA